MTCSQERSLSCRIYLGPSKIKGHSNSFEIECPNFPIAVFGMWTLEKLRSSFKIVEQSMEPEEGVRFFWLEWTVPGSMSLLELWRRAGCRNDDEVGGVRWKSGSCVTEFSGWGIPTCRQIPHCWSSDEDWTKAVILSCICGGWSGGSRSSAGAELWGTRDMYWGLGSAYWGSSPGSLVTHQFFWLVCVVPDPLETAGIVRKDWLWGGLWVGRDWALGWILRDQNSGSNCSPGGSRVSYPLVSWVRLPILPMFNPIAHIRTPKCDVGGCWTTVYVIPSRVKMMKFSFCFAASWLNGCWGPVACPSLLELVLRRPLVVSWLFSPEISHRTHII